MSEELEFPPVADAVVEMGVVRMRVGVGEGGQMSYRPRICLWVDQQSGTILHFELAEPADSYIPLVMESLAKLADRMRATPGQIQLRDPNMARALKDILKPIGVEVVVRESLPMLDEAVGYLLSTMGPGGAKHEPSLLEVPGMTLDHLMAFADAGKVFYEAEPWQYLIDDDLIEIESPSGPKGTQFTQVLGAGGQTYGLGFVGSRKAHEEVRTGKLPRGAIWNLLYDRLDDLAFDDGEAWERHDLPAAGPEAYPSFVSMSKSKSGVTHPTPGQLIWAEGLLRALAATTEEELDRGRWEKQVETFDGKATYKFSLPILLEQMAGKTGADPATSIHAARMQMEAMLRGIGQQLANAGPMSEEQTQQYLNSSLGKPQEFKPTTNAERAQALCYQAQQARGRRQVQLAREALAIDPDCVDALTLLAERHTDPAIALPLYLRAMEAGERQLGKERFEEDAGHFWGILETRPYMRARYMIAMTLMSLDRYEEAAGHLTEMLRLNPRDNQGARYSLVQCLLQLNQLDRLETLLNIKEYDSADSAQWAFARLLLAYRRHGDSPEAHRQLAAAQKTNEFVIPLLIGKKQAPVELPDSYSPGSIEEAVLCVEESISAWTQTPGALQWLEEAGDRARKRAKQWERQRGKKKKK